MQLAETQLGNAYPLQPKETQLANADPLQLAETQLIPIDFDLVAAAGHKKEEYEEEHGEHGKHGLHTFIFLFIIFECIFQQVLINFINFSNLCCYTHVFVKILQSFKFIAN